MLYQFLFCSLPILYDKEDVICRENDQQMIAVVNAVKQKKVESIKYQINSLENLREYYEGKKLRFQDRASRYQFQDNIQSSEKLFREADRLQCVIDEIDSELEVLQQKLKELLE